VHTFGSTRIGNPGYSKHYKERIENIYRVVHDQDFAPHTPPDFFDYTHTPYEIFFNSDMTSYKTCGSSGEDFSCSKKYFPNFNINDHKLYFIDMENPQC
jgi:hypothetical protein